MSPEVIEETEFINKDMTNVTMLCVFKKINKRLEDIKIPNWNFLK